MRSREVIELLQADGWYEVAVKGSHHQFKHPTKEKSGDCSAPQVGNPGRTLHSIMKQAGLK